MSGTFQEWFIPPALHVPQPTAPCFKLARLCQLVTCMRDRRKSMARRRDLERQEAETWRSLHQFARNALELSMNRRRRQSAFDAIGDVEAGMNDLMCGASPPITLSRPPSDLALERFDVGAHLFPQLRRATSSLGERGSLLAHREARSGSHWGGVRGAGVSAHTRLRARGCGDAGRSGSLGVTRAPWDDCRTSAGACCTTTSTGARHPLTPPLLHVDLLHALECSIVLARGSLLAQVGVANAFGCRCAGHVE